MGETQMCITPTGLPVRKQMWQATESRPEIGLLNAREVTNVRGGILNFTIATLVLVGRIGVSMRLPEAITMVLLPPFWRLIQPQCNIIILDGR